MVNDKNTESTGQKPVDENENKDEQSSSEGYESGDQHDSTPDLSDKRQPSSQKKQESSEKPKTPNSSKNESNPDSTSGKLHRRKSKSSESSEKKKSVRRKLDLSFEDRSCSNVIHVPAEIPQNSENRNAGIDLIGVNLKLLSMLSDVFRGIAVIVYFQFLSCFIDILNYIRRCQVPIVSIDLERLFRILFFNRFSTSIFVWLMLTILNSGFHLQLTYISPRTDIQCATPVLYEGNNLVSIPFWDGTEDYFNLNFNALNLREGVRINETTRRIFLSLDRRMLLFRPISIPPRIIGTLLSRTYPEPDRIAFLRGYIETMLHEVEDLILSFGPDEIDEAMLHKYYHPDGSDRS